MSSTEVSAAAARATAHTVLVALEYAEARIMPNPDAHSRLYVAVEAAKETAAFVAFPTDSGRTRLRLRLEDVQRVESAGVDLGNLDPDSLIQHGISLSIHVAQAALYRLPTNAIHVLRETRLIVTLANQIGAERA